MRVVKPDIQGMRPEIGKIISGHLFQSQYKGLGHLHDLKGVAIRLSFKSSGNGHGYGGEEEAYGLP